MNIRIKGLTSSFLYLLPFSGPFFLRNLFTSFLFNLDLQLNLRGSI